MAVCPACELSSWTGNPTALFSDDLESYGGNEIAFEAVWGGSPGNPLTNTKAYSGTWSAGASPSADTFFRGITPPTNNIIFSFQVYWTGIVPTGQGAIQFTHGAAHDGFNRQCGIQFTSGGEIIVMSSSSGTPVETSASVLIQNQWNCVTGLLHITQGDGAYKVYCNSALVLEGDSANLAPVGIGNVVGGVTFGVGGNYWIDNLWAATVESFDGTEFCTGPPNPPPPTCTCTPPPGTPPPLPPTPPTNPPPLPPVIGAQLACIGGGLVPTQADLTYVETWWGL
jgi:hypothetical protein